MLGKIGPAAAESVPALAAALNDFEKHIRLGAASALGSIGPMAATAKDALLDAMKDSDGDVRAEAARALQRIRSDQDHERDRIDLNSRPGV